MNTFCLWSFWTNDATNFPKVMKLMSSLTCHLRFLIFVLETLKFEWQCGQYLELNPTCALAIWYVASVDFLSRKRNICLQHQVVGFGFMMTWCFCYVSANQTFSRQNICTIMFNVHTKHISALLQSMLLCIITGIDRKKEQCERSVHSSRILISSKDSNGKPRMCIIHSSSPKVQFFHI